MAQPSVANYFNSRKRAAIGDLNPKLLKKVAIDRGTKSVEAASSDNTKQNIDDATNNGSLQTVANILLQNKLHFAKTIHEKGKKVTVRKATRIRKPKNSDQQDIQVLFNNMQKNEITIQPEQTDLKEEIQEVPEIEHKTPPQSPHKNTNALDKVVITENTLSLNQLKMKLCRSNRLAELKASMQRLKASQAKLDKIEEKTSKIPDSPSLKAFKTIEFEVNLSPQKLVSPDKSYLSPRKDSSARKNLLNLLSPTKNAISLPSKTSVTKQLFQPSHKPPLPLPYKYRSLAELYRCIDTVCQIMHNRKETITFKRLKPAVEEMVKRNLYEKHLAQIMMVLPQQFVVKQERMRVFGNGTKQEQWELVVVPLIGQASMTADVVLERRRMFLAALTEKVKVYHDEYLASLDPPMTVDRNKITRWHPEFDIEKVPDIDEVLMPQAPTEDKLKSGKEVLERAKIMFNCNTRMELAMKRLQEKQAASTKDDPTPQEVPVKKQPDSLLKGIPPALLEKVRQRQAAKALETMTRTDSKDKEVQHYNRLPEMCRLTRNLFVGEKKSVLPLDVVLNKLDNSMRTFLARDDLEQHLRTISREFPTWMVFHDLRGTVFVKICKTTDLSVIISKLEQIIKDKTNV